MANENISGKVVGITGASGHEILFRPTRQEM